jgi:hypothetical protein
MPTPMPRAYADGKNPEWFDGILTDKSRTESFGLALAAGAKEGYHEKSLSGQTDAWKERKGDLMMKREISAGMKRRLTNEVKNYAIQEGVDLVGIASVENYLKVQNPPEGHTPEDILPGSTSLVVMIVAGIDFPRLDKLTTLNYPGLEKAVDNFPLGTIEYNAHNTTLQCGRGGYAHMDILAHHVARFLIKNDFNAVPLGTGHPYYQEPLHGVISHKHAAVQAGLG